MDSVYAGPILIVVLAAVCYGIERLRDYYGKPPPKSMSPTEADLQQAVAQIANAVRADLGASIEPSGKIRRLKASFVLLRARRLVEKDPTLRDPSRAADWKAAVVASFHQVEPYLAQKLGTVSARGPLFGGATDLQPPHLDLAQFATSRNSDFDRGFGITTDAEAVAAASPTKSQRFALNELDRRRDRVLEIVWRAAGIETGVWDPDGTLREPDLTELLDRRLRSVERLAYQASAGARHDGLGSSNIERHFVAPSPGDDDKSGPIVDDFLVRPFEAPSVPKTAVPALFHISNGPQDRRYVSASEPWYWNRVTNEFDLDVWPGTKPGELGFMGLGKPLQGAPFWTLAPDEAGERRGYAWILTPQGNVGPAQVIQDMFARAASIDWFERSWLLPEGVFSALHLEALQHALKRRTSSDEQFDALIHEYKLVLGDAFDVLKHARVPDSIFAPGVTDHFENDVVAENELQVGDQILFDVHPVLFGLWDHEYPTAMVTSVDPYPDGTASQIRIRVQGFNTAELTVGEFQSLHVKQMDRLLDVLRDYAVQNVASLRAGNRLKWQAGEIPPFLLADAPPTANWLIFEWQLFKSQVFDDPGGLWIHVRPQAHAWRGLVPNDLKEAVRQIPKSVIAVPEKIELLVNERGSVVEVVLSPEFESEFVFDLGQDKTSLYWPLNEPEGGWAEYYLQKQLHPERTWPSRLLPVRIDGTWVPKITRDAQGRLRVLRPRLKPPAA